MTILGTALHYDAVTSFMNFFQLRFRPPDCTVLEEVLHHFSSIPYENLSKILKFQKAKTHEDRFRLPEEVMSDHIDHNLGGTCFSLIFFLHSLLTKNGFSCYPVMADMRAGENTHCCLIVTLGAEKYLVDPGYILTQPMKLNTKTSSFSQEKWRKVILQYDRNHNRYDLFTQYRGETKWRYRFMDTPASSYDTFFHYWASSFTKNSMNGICLTRTTNDGLLYVRKNFMRYTTENGQNSRNIKEDYYEAIRETFGIKQEIVVQAEGALRRHLEKTGRLKK